uniref:Ras-associating and dilute domain-containing protein-like n=1 Tax=Stegastes partitus TaxID=144197 RepID=A0A3B5B9K1_9TELE
SSLSTCRSAEGVAVRQPSKSRIRRHTNRLSGVFLHRPASSSDALIVDDPAELSNQITAPGILKIFGNEICEGAHYKSVLATTHSSAKELVKEALERYGLGKEEAESYVLCDTIGSIGSLQWRTEGFRVVGDNEKPLLLQSLWKPREGLARRFEIQKRSSVEEKTSKDKDTVTAGINAQARKLQKSRSRVTSTLIDRTLGRTQKLWRSKSEMDLLDTETKQDMDHDTGEREGEESEREETESSDDNTTQYSIHPPHDCPYLLLLQGWSLAQDFVIYLLAGPNIVIGQKSDHEDESKVDVLLFAADILPRHCCLHRCSAGGPTILCPGQGAVVTRNGQVLRNDTQLSPGDVIGLGQHYLFLFKDPLAVTQKMILCSTCISTCTKFQSTNCRQPLSGGPPVLSSPEGHSLTLDYKAEDEDRIVKEIVAMGSSSSSINSSPPLTVSFLLCMCVQHSSACLHTSDLRRLLLLTASAVQNVMWEHTKDLAAVHDDGSNSEYLKELSLHEVISGLRPLVAWMSNSLELLQFIQYQLPLILEWRTRKDWLWLQTQNLSSEETMAVLEEVIMLAFQQCVYYVTKVLYPILPGLLDCNPFRGSHEGAGESQVVEVLTESWTLLSDCQLHPEVSSQLIGYLFYFINASLFNSLMERGSEPGFYQWSRGVRMRANLDVLLDWAHAAGLGEVASEHTHTLSSAINLLATPRKNLLQVKRQTHTHTICRESKCWTYSPFSKFLNYGFQMRSSCSNRVSLQGGDIQMDAELTKMTLPNAVVETSATPPSEDNLSQADVQNCMHSSTTSVALPPLPPSPPSPLFTHYLEEFSSCGADILSQKLRNLELQTRETESIELKRSALDPSCLLTPPNTPHSIDPVDLMNVDQERWMRADSEALTWSTGVDAHDEGTERHFNEVFSLELERGERGLGLALVDTRVKGIFIRAVVPDSPAARCERLLPGDRILAVNGVSLLGLDYQSGKELIQSSGARLRLLVARSAWMAETIRTEC